MTSNEYAYWQAALAGKKPPIHDGDPQTGFYRKRNKPFNGQPKADDPVAIWMDGGQFVALVGPKNRSRTADAAEIWTWVADKPISYEDYTAAFEKNAWDKAIEGLAPVERGVGHNNPPTDPFEDLKSQIDNAVQQADQALSVDVTTKEQADRLANIKDRLLQLWKDAEAKRVEEKKPHDDAGKAVQAKWSPILDVADKAKKKLLARIDAWISAENKRIAQAQFEAAKAAEAAGEEIPTPTVQTVQVGGAVSGRKTSSRSRKVATITDPVAFATFLLSGQTPNPDVMAALQKCANKIVANGGTADGLETKTERKAA